MPQAWPFLRLGLLLLAGAPLRAQPAPTRAVDAFVVAHADDWQLFMGDVMVRARLAGAPTLVVILSAGDAGRATAFWQARERGALASMAAARALAGQAPEGHRCEDWRLDAEHLVRRCWTGDAATVFLRLPDGRPDGTGFPTHGAQSLLKLQHATIPQLESLDGQTRYRSLEDLIRTIERILSAAHRPGYALRVHTHDPDPMVNPLDHTDHRVAGAAAIAAAQALHAQTLLYSGYTNVRRADNLPAVEAAWKAFIFVQYDRALLDVAGTWSAYAENAWAHAAYLSRTYVRAAPGPTGGLLRFVIP